MAAPRRILLIRPSALGDVCRSVAILASLRRAYPAARIDWLVQDTFLDAVRAHPALSGVVPFPRADLARAMRRGGATSLLKWLARLREPRYELVIDAQGLFRSAFFAWATGARDRVGHRRARELGWLFYTRRERGSEALHTVDRMLALVREAGIDPVVDMSLYAPPEGIAWACADHRIAEPFALFAPTSRWTGKQWPADRYRTVALRLLGDGLVARIAVVGGRNERQQCAPLLELAQRDGRVIDLVGETSIGGLMALVRRSALVLANDSAALHMAVGFERPLVGLFGPTRVERVGPYGRSADVIQHVHPGDRLDHKDAPGGLALMGRIGADEVYEACAARLSRGAARTPA
ncbi:MAG TPA: glycosyltransferase family 9 protein [Phycisphaerales bacterium]|nr:glycosyltransferase family 9 protein [Phycisphaerales bacterium]